MVAKTLFILFLLHMCGQHKRRDIRCTLLLLITKTINIHETDDDDNNKLIIIIIIITKG